MENDNQKYRLYADQYTEEEFDFDRDVNLETYLKLHEDLVILLKEEKEREREGGQTK